MKGVSRDMLQGVMGWNWIGEANTGEAGENNCMKLTQKKYVSDFWIHQSTVCTRMPFWRDYFWIVNLFTSNCVRPNTCQDAVFPLSCWHIWQFLLHRCSLSSDSLMIPFWRSRVGFHPWCTGRAIGRHIWKWRLNIFPSHSRYHSRTILSLCCWMKVLFFQDPILTVDHLGRNQYVENRIADYLNISWPKIYKQVK